MNDQGGAATEVWGEATQRMERALPVQAGIVIAERYQLEEPLGRGGHGEVWAARDGVLDRLVAVKLLSPANPRQRARLRREIALLRLLAVPGVVRLHDDGNYGDRAYIAMALVDGHPFPGRRPPQTWKHVAPAAIALAETLDRIHAHGVVHRDLKPGNVLVSPTGDCTVLDFGLSIATNEGDRVTDDDVILGTPAYLAPEAVLGHPPSVSMDLFAFGVMLYESLSRRIPHQTSDHHAMLRARASLPAPPLRGSDLAPRHVLEVIDQLVALDPAQRPRSAAEVVARLRGTTTKRSSVPRLGGRAQVEAALARLRAGKPLAVTGAPGSGRTRLVQDVLAEWQGDEPALLLDPATEPFESLRGALGPPDIDTDASLPEAREQLRTRLRDLLASGRLIVGDGLESLDSFSAALLQEVTSGPLLITRSATASAEDALALESLPAMALRPLFAGPDAVLHLREDAAALLHARTAGNPRAVVAELDAWIRAGWVTKRGKRHHISRATIDRLHATDRLRAAAPQSLAVPLPTPTALRDSDIELLHWVALAGDHANVARLAELTGEPRWRLEARLDALAALGLVHTDGEAIMLARGERPRGWTQVQWRDGHRRLAQVLSPGAPGRWWHLLMSAHDEDIGLQDAEALADEAHTVASDAARCGRLAEAAYVLSETMVALSRCASGEVYDHERTLVVLWLEVAVAGEGPAALDALTFALARRPADELLGAVRLLAQAALAVATKPGPLALAEVEQVPEDPRLERWQRELRDRAAQRCPLVTQEAIVADNLAWVATRDDAGSRAAGHRWQARLAYRHGDFDNAADQHHRAASCEPWLSMAVDDHLRSAAAAMETFDYAAATAGAERALQLATEARLTHHEAMAAWALRSARYRMGDSLRPDPELVEAARLLHAPEPLALTCLIEGTIAYRARDNGLAQQLCGEATDTWRQTGKEWPALLARSIALAAGAIPEPDEVHAMVTAALDCPVAGLGIQIAALASDALGPERILVDEAERAALARSVPEEHWLHRLDVISVTEALAILQRSAS